MHVRLPGLLAFCHRPLPPSLPSLPRVLPHLIRVGDNHQVVSRQLLPTPKSAIRFALAEECAALLRCAARALPSRKVLTPMEVSRGSAHALSSSPHGHATVPVHRRGCASTRKAERDRRQAWQCRLSQWQAAALCHAWRTRLRLHEAMAMAMARAGNTSATRMHWFLE